MEKIEVGEYIRTKDGLIGKVNKIEIAGSGCRFAGEFFIDTIIQFNDGKIYERRVKVTYIVKHSKNIIDLIEVGDFVNNEYMSHSVDIYVRFIRDKNEIKTILTHEQYMQNCYKVEEK